LKKVIVGLAGNWNPGNSLTGVLDLIELPGNRVSFMYSGEIPELITFLSGKMITDLTIEEPSLEEIFMHYYK
jgi:ABC-2 type transport system ATP-binding protein